MKRDEHVELARSCSLEIFKALSELKFTTMSYRTICVVDGRVEKYTVEVAINENVFDGEVRGSADGPRVWNCMINVFDDEVSVVVQSSVVVNVDARINPEEFFSNKMKKRVFDDRGAWLAATDFAEFVVHVRDEIAGFLFNEAVLKASRSS